jgi:aspartyl-tRNA(Asn)/glutamyl-tRNA(Gln) amidotransferase subunit A
MTRTVTDAALMMNVCAGPDPRDQFSLPASPVDYVKALKGGIKGLRVAWVPDPGYAKLVDPEVAAVCARAAKRFREMGCRVEEVNPRWPSPLQPWKAIFCGGVAARLAPYLPQRRADIDSGLAALIDETLSCGPTTYVQAWFDRMAWWEHPRRLFETYDIMLTPTVACPPFKVGLDNPTEIAGRPAEPYEWIPFTYPFNMTGQPACSVPAGFTPTSPGGAADRRPAETRPPRATRPFEKAQLGTTSGPLSRTPVGPIVGWRPALWGVSTPERWTLTGTGR